MLFRSLAEDFRDVYNAVREALTREEYEAWREEVVSSFRNEEELWESMSGEVAGRGFIF